MRLKINNIFIENFSRHPYFSVQEPLVYKQPGFI